MKRQDPTSDSPSKSGHELFDDLLSRLNILEVFLEHVFNARNVV